MVFRPHSRHRASLRHRAVPRHRAGRCYPFVFAFAFGYASIASSPVLIVTGVALITAAFGLPVNADADDTSSSREAATLADLAEARRWDDVAGRLRRGDDPDAAQPDGMTPLHWAVRHGHVDMVAKLLAAGVDPDAATYYGVTPLEIACELGEAAVVRRLLAAGADVDKPGSTGDPVLLTAARTGRIEPVRRLLDRGVEVDATQINGQTALMWAAAEGHADVVDALVNAGADINRALSSGMTALTFAARGGKSDVVARLLDAGADFDAAIDPKGTPRGRAPRRRMSPLMFAIENAHFELAVRLVERGADPNDQRSGYAPLHALTWVRKTNRGEGIDGDPPPRVAGSIGSLDFARFLIDRGGDVNLRLDRGSAGGKAKLNSRGATPFLMAAKTADLPYLRLLLDRGADPTIPNADGCTPVLAAAGVGVTAVGEEAGTEPEVLASVRFLAELGVDLNTVDENGETVMHGAAYRSYPEVARLLHQLGADPHVWYRENRHGWTPHRIAQGYRPGSFKPSPEMIAAIEEGLRDAGIEPPMMANRAKEPKQDRWAKPKPKPEPKKAADAEPDAKHKNPGAKTQDAGGDDSAR